VWVPAEAPGIDGSALDQFTERIARTGVPDPGTPPVGVDLTRPLEHIPKGLAEVGGALLSGLDTTLAAIISRIRSDPNLATTAGLKTSQVVDHLPTFLADVAGALVTMDESGGSRSPLLADAIEIQRLISERHGSQRTRLGWTESDLRREFMIIREELKRVVMAHFGAGRAANAVDAVGVLNRFLDHSEYVAVRSHDALRNRGSEITGR